MPVLPPFSVEGTTVYARTVADLCSITDLTQARARSMLAAAGITRTNRGNNRGGYELRPIFQFLLAAVEKGGIDPTKPLADQEPSAPKPPPALKGDPRDSYVKKQEAMLDIKIAEKKKDLLPARVVTDALFEITTHIRQAGDQLGREYGAEAQILLNEAVDAAECVVAELGSEYDPEVELDAEEA